MIMNIKSPTFFNNEFCNTFEQTDIQLQEIKHVIKELCHELQTGDDRLEHYIEFVMDLQASKIYKVLIETKRIDITEEEFMHLLKSY